jgi:hypothetical protein
MNLCSRAYLLFRREKRSGASFSRCFKDQRDNRHHNSWIQSVISGNDPPVGHPPHWFHSTVHSSCSVTAPRFLNSRPTRMQLPYPLQTMGFNINRVTTCVFSRSREATNRVMQGPNSPNSIRKYERCGQRRVCCAVLLFFLSIPLLLMGQDKKNQDVFDKMHVGAFDPDAWNGIVFDGTAHGQRVPFCHPSGIEERTIPRWRANLRCCKHRWTTCAGWFLRSPELAPLSAHGPSHVGVVTHRQNHGCRKAKGSGRYAFGA